MKIQVLIVYTTLAVCLLTGPAMGIIVDCHQEWMHPQHPCDQAGTIDIYFSATDINDVNDHLSNAAGGFVLLRFTLNGINIDPTHPYPTLCTDIQFDSDGDSIPDGINDFAFSNPSQSWANVVSLDSIGSEVTDWGTNGTPDLNAFIHGVSGNQYFEVVLWGVNPALVTQANSTGFSNDYTEWPRISVGQHEPHALHVDVSAFRAWSTLGVSLDIRPITISYSPGEERIGHFFPPVEVSVCDGYRVSPDCHYDAEIPLGSNVDDKGQISCASYHACSLSAWGSWPSSDVHITVSAPQAGVYLQKALWKNLQTDVAGSLALFVDPSLSIPISGSAVPALGGCSFEAKSAYAIIPGLHLPVSFDDRLALCITYTVQSAEMSPGTQIQFHVTASVPSSKYLFSKTVPGGLTRNTPLASTYAPRNVTATTALLQGYILQTGGLDCEYRFRYQQECMPAQYTAWTGPITNPANVGAHLENLSSGSPYTFELEVRNEEGSDLGSIRRFTTLSEIAIYVADPDPNNLSGNGTATNPYHTIQQAIDDAPHGALIKVHSGIYHENLIIDGKNLSLVGMSANKPDQHGLPILHGKTEGPVIQFTGGTDADCILKGFIITGPSASAGILLDNSSPTLENCIIHGIRDYGIFASGSSSVFTQCMITGNGYPDNPHGGGLCSDSSTLTLRNSTINMNWPQDICVLSGEAPTQGN